jgi:isopentenyldiphosphate isomerase
MGDYYYFMIQGYSKPFGYMHKSILQGLNLSSSWQIDKEQRTLTMVSSKSTTFKGRTEVMREALQQAVKEGKATSPQRFYDEPLRVVSSEGEHVLDMDRSGLDPFGVISFSAHMIGFVNDGNSIKYWVPKRSPTKPTVPNKLDSTVAGVVRSSEQPIDCMVRKIAAEASLPAEYTKANIVSCGTISYQMSITSTGNPGCQHITSYLYEMEFKEGVAPQPGNDEVGTFTLMTQEDVMTALENGDFVANRAMVWVAYFIRHGILTLDNEPDFVEICRRLHKEHDMFIVEDLNG